MPRLHDMGGNAAGPIERTEHHLAEWEILADAVNQALGAKGVRRTDESRRSVEDLPAEEYLGLKYYEKWIAGLEVLLDEKRILSREEIDRRVAEQEKRAERR